MRHPTTFLDADNPVEEAKVYYAKQAEDYIKSQGTDLTFYFRAGDVFRIVQPEAERYAELSATITEKGLFSAPDVEIHYALTLWKIRSAAKEIFSKVELRDYPGYHGPFDGGFSRDRFHSESAKSLRIRMDKFWENQSLLGAFLAQLDKILSRRGIAERKMAERKKRWQKTLEWIQEQRGEISPNSPKELP